MGSAPPRGERRASVGRFVRTCQAWKHRNRREQTHDSQYVVAGVDGSLIAVRALDWAAEEAVRRGVTLRIVYAAPERDEAEPILASAVSRIRAHHRDLPVERVGRGRRGGGAGA